MVFKIRTLSLPIPRTREDLLIIHSSPLKKFSWRELQVATDNFSKKNFLGRGGFGIVYKGILRDGSVVAVKRLSDHHTQGGKIMFQTEVEIGGCQLSSHRNVVRLLGYCMTQKERLLVYPFMHNLSVASRLRYRPESEPPLDWATRKRIALGAAKGLAHLHSGTSFKVIQRDVKAANILLDDQFEAHLGDFGLSRFVDRSSQEELIPSSDAGWVRRPMEEEEDEEAVEDECDHDCFTISCWNITKTVMVKPKDEDEAREGTKRLCWQLTKNEVISISGGDGSGGTIGPPNIHDFTQVTTAARGTIGYIAPEYLSSGKCSLKNDVFGYGITLLELITAQRAFDLARIANKEDVMLHDRVKGHVQDNKLEMVIDPDLRADYIKDKEEVEQLLQLALLCTQGCPVDRPGMSEVVNIIENIGKTPPRDLLSPIPSSTDPEAEIAAATGWATYDRAGCIWVASNHSNWIQFQSTPAQPQPEPLHQVFEPPQSPAEEVPINNAAAK